MHGFVPTEPSERRGLEVARGLYRASPVLKYKMIVSEINRVSCGPTEGADSSRSPQLDRSCVRPLRRVLQVLCNSQWFALLCFLFGGQFLIIVIMS